MQEDPRVESWGLQRKRSAGSPLREVLRRKKTLVSKQAGILLEDFAWEAVVEEPNSVQFRSREKLVTHDSSDASFVLCLSFFPAPGSDTLQKQ